MINVYRCNLLVDDWLEKERKGRQTSRDVVIGQSWILVYSMKFSNTDMVEPHLRSMVQVGALWCCIVSIVIFESMIGLTQGLSISVNHLFKVTRI